MVGDHKGTVPTNDYKGTVPTTELHVIHGDDPWGQSPAGGGVHAVGRVLCLVKWQMKVVDNGGGMQSLCLRRILLYLSISTLN